MVASVVLPYSGFPLGEVSPQMFGDPAMPVYRRGLSECYNFKPLRQGGIAKVPGTLYCGHTASDATARLVSWVLDAANVYVLEFTNNLLRFWQWSGGTLAHVAGQDIVTTYATSELNDIQFGFHYPYLFMAHQNHAPAMITWASGPTFTLASIPFSGANPLHVTGTIATGTAVTLTVGSLTPDTPGGSTYNNYVGWAVTGSGVPAGTTISAVSGSTAFTLSQSATNATGVSLTLSAPYVSGSTPALPFQSSGNYPAVCSVAFQRLYFANTKNDPLGLWASAVGIFDSQMNVQMGTYETVQYQSSQMTVDSNGQPTAQPPVYTTTYTNSDNVFDADGIYYEVDSDKNDSVQWIAPSLDLFIGSASGLWVEKANASANTFSVQLVERSGSGSVPGRMVEGGVMFSSPYGRRLGQMGWHGVYNPWIPPDDITFFATHIFDKATIQVWDFQQHPETVVWFVVSDGTLVCLLLDNAHQVRAFFHRTTNGTVTSACVIRGDDRDVVALSVTRGAYNLVEIVDDDNWYDTTAPNDGQVNANFLDAAVTKTSSVAFTSVTGLDHLDGLTVGMVGDGAYLGTAVVSSGAVTLPTASKVAHVGLEFTSHFRSAPVDIGTPEQSTVGYSKGISVVYVRTLRALDAQVGPDASNLQQLELGGAVVGSANPAMFSGDEAVPFENEQATPAYVYFQSAKPLPCTILAFSAQTEVGVV